MIPNTQRMLSSTSACSGWMWLNREQTDVKHRTSSLGNSQQEGNTLPAAGQKGSSVFIAVDQTASSGLPQQTYVHHLVDQTRSHWPSPTHDTPRLCCMQMAASSSAGDWWLPAVKWHFRARGWGRHTSRRLRSQRDDSPVPDRGRGACAASPAQWRI